ncbi:MAG TPA: hypothetical protein VIE37_11070 [Methylomirabilota bacterium]|jgi:hypothetical protein
MDGRVTSLLAGLVSGSTPARCPDCGRAMHCLDEEMVTVFPATFRSIYLCLACGEQLARCQVWDPNHP